MADNLSTQIANDTIDQTLNLMRFDAGLRRKIIVHLQQMEKELVAALAQIDPTSPSRGRYRQQRLEELLRQARAIIQTGYGSLYAEQRTDLSGMAEVEQARLIATINAGIGVNLFRPIIAAENLLALIDDTILTAGASSADTVKGWWEQQSGSFASRYANTIRQGMYRDESLSQLIKRTRDIGVAVRRDAETLVRTSVLGVANEVNDQMLKGNSDWIKGVAIVTTLDSRTCLTGETKIHTPEGKKPISNLKSGDYVYGGSGRSRRIKATLRSKTKRVVRVKLSNGQSVICTSDHQFLTDIGWIESVNLKKNQRLMERNVIE